MSTITMDPPHLVHTGGACMRCCTLAPGKLLRCSGCDSAWYCNQECQRQHFKQHKPFCRALRLFHALQADLPPESWPRTAQEFYVQRINCQQLLEPMLRRPLSRLERRAILGEAKCSVCMRTRAQLAKEALTMTAHGSNGPAAATTPDAAAPAAAGLPSPPTTGNRAGAGVGPATTPPAEDAKEATEPATETASASGPGPGSTLAVAAQPNAQLPAGVPDRTGSSTASAAVVGAAVLGSGSAPAPAPTPGAGTGSAASACGLSCCPQCHWGWACGAHRGAYLAGPHAAACLQYRHMNDSQLTTQRYLAATGRLPNYVPDTPWRPTGRHVVPAVGRPQQHEAHREEQARQRQPQTRGSAGAGEAPPLGGHAAAWEWEPVPAGWTAFQGWRPLPAFDAGTMCLLTKRMSQALTVVQALQHHYSPAHLAGLRALEVHVLGASGFEVPADRIWEELLNLLPFGPETGPGNGLGAGPGAAPSPLPGPGGGEGRVASGSEAGAAGPRLLHVAFVGPELRDIIVEDSDGLALQQGTALAAPPPPPGRELLYSYHLTSYQDWAAGRRSPRRCCNGGGTAAAAGGGREAAWRRPDIAVAFNSGVSESDKDLWAPALELLVRHDVPVVFTSYNGEEAAADAAVWRAAGGAVTLGPEPNPFRVLEPIAEPSEIDQFYFQNYYWWCGRASAGGRGV